MRKLIDGLAIASFVLSLTTVGAIGFGYLALTNKTNQEKIKIMLSVKFKNYLLINLVNQYQVFLMSQVM